MYNENNHKNNAPHLKSPKNQNRRAPLGRPAMNLLGGFRKRWHNMYLAQPWNYLENSDIIRYLAQSWSYTENGDMLYYT